MAHDDAASDGRIRVKVTPIDSPDAEEYYANITGVGMTQADFVLLFGRMLPPDQSRAGDIQIKPRVRILIPLFAARHLVRQLQEQINKHIELITSVGQEEEEDDNSDVDSPS